MTALLVVFSGIFGLAIGSFLNVVVARVPVGVPLVRESRCPRCDSAIRPWQNVPVLSWLALRGRCAGCALPISARYPLVELSTAAAFVAVTWFLLAEPPASVATAPIALAVTVIAYLFLAAISIALTLIDIDSKRLPDAIVLPAYPVVFVLLFVASLLAGDVWAIGRAVIGGGALYAFYFVLRAVKPRGMGAGDVKLAGVLGMALGWFGFGALAVGAFAAFVLGGLFGLALIALRRAGRGTAIPFGPWMLAGAWIGIFAGEALAGWYIGLFAA